MLLAVYAILALAFSFFTVVAYKLVVKRQQRQQDLKQDLNHNLSYNLNHI